MIDSLLNNYKSNIAKIEMIKLKIAEWESILLMNPLEIDTIYRKYQSENLGITKTRVSNPTEELMIRVEKQKEKINSWIEDKTKAMEELNRDIQITEILINSLDEENAYIIKQKHFENKKWNNITYTFNSKYRNELNDYITESGIRKRYSTIKASLSKLLIGFEQFDETLSG